MTSLDAAEVQRLLADAFAADPAERRLAA